ncbi:MAG TPA: NAD-dependent epimerase/dehydratase family protein [bacterium]|nr:NAD-dependent epimerase/dehydratase family protein [bacterium]
MTHTSGNGWPTPDAGPVLVTGGCGFLGHHLVRRLLDEGHEVAILDDLSTGTLANVPTDDERLHVVEGSVLDPAAVRRAAEDAAAVFHLAGVVGMRLAVGDRDRAYNIAVDGTRNVLEATGNTPVVLYSSSAVYGLTSRVAVSEDQTPGESGVLAYDGGYRGYATGKWELEKLGQAAATTGRPVLIVRPFNAVGEGQTGTYGMVVPSFIRMARSGEPLTVYDDGEQSRTFSEVRTFVDALMRLVVLPEAWAFPRNVFNIGTSESTTIGELAQIVLEETDSESVVHYIPYGEIFPGKQDVRARVPDTTRLERLIGPVEWPTIREVVRELVRIGVGAAVRE